MLSELQRKNVWEGWLSAEIRANYFADLSYQYQHRQQVLTWLTLVFSSGAFITFITDWIPVEWEWVRPFFAALTAAVSLWAVVGQYHKVATDCSDLHFRWNRLSAAYEALWDDMYSDEAPVTLHALKEQDAELSKSGTR